MLFSPSAVGFFLEIGDAVPADAIEISDDAYHALIAAQTAGKQIVAGPSGAPVAVDRRMPAMTPAQAVENLLANGLTIASTGTPAINGVYPCDPASRAVYAEVVSGINAGHGFPGGDATFDFDLQAGHVTFPTTASFVAAGVAVATFVYRCSQVARGRSQTLPPSSVTIA